MANTPALAPPAMALPDPPRCPNAIAVWGKEEGRRGRWRGCQKRGPLTVRARPEHMHRRLAVGRLVAVAVWQKWWRCDAVAADGL